MTVNRSLICGHVNTYAVFLAAGSVNFNVVIRMASHKAGAGSTAESNLKKPPASADRKKKPQPECRKPRRPLNPARVQIRFMIRRCSVGDPWEAHWYTGVLSEQPPPSLLLTSANGKNQPRACGAACRPDDATAQHTVTRRKMYTYQGTVDGYGFCLTATSKLGSPSPAQFRIKMLTSYICMYIYIIYFII